MDLNSDWYEYLNKEKSLQQGELIQNLPILMSPKKIENDEKGKFKVNPVITRKNVIILSQSCDLEQEKIKIITVCPFVTISELIENNAIFQDDNKKEDLRRGYFPYLHLLDKVSDIYFNNDLLVVNFRNIFTTHNEYLKDFVINQTSRIALKSPYIEHLSQSFARFFMRVGLPSTIKPFVKE